MEFGQQLTIDSTIYLQDKSLQHSHHAHDHGHHHQDLNQKAAFLHVLADAATSVLAIIALFAGKYFGWNFLDSVLGILGAILVAKWALGLITETGKILLDAEMEEPIVEEIKEAVHQLDRSIDIIDIHVWQVGKGKFSCILSFNVTLIYLIVLRISQLLKTNNTNLYALIVSLLYITSPILVESTVWAVGRFDLMVTSFILLGLLVFLNFQKNLIRDLILSIIFIFGLFCKELAIIFPVILFVFSLYFVNKNNFLDEST